MYFIFFLFLAACSFGPWAPKNKPVDNQHNLELPDLLAKRDAYCAYSKAHFDVYGYLNDKCDALLYTSLHQIACGPYFSTDAFEDKENPGKFFRDAAHDCLKTGESDSESSKDMYLGELSADVAANRADRVDRIISYGEAHNWVMCDAENDVAKAGKCVFTPALIHDLYKIKDKLYGKTLAVTSSGNADSFGVNTGFRAHLDVLHILMRGHVDGGISDVDLQTLKAQAGRVPENALFQAALSRYTDGNFDIPIGLLLDTRKFPVEKLPNSKENSCNNYLWSTDNTPLDWAPCPDRGFKEFDGTDLVFVAAIIEGSY